jgi:hypothetical protein
MKLFLLQRTAKGKAISPQYDVNVGFVVRAHTAQHARELANDPEFGGDEKRNGDPNFWLDSEFSTCEQLKLSGKAEVILREFNAG